MDKTIDVLLEENKELKEKIRKLGHYKGREFTDKYDLDNNLSLEEYRNFFKLPFEWSRFELWIESVKEYNSYLCDYETFILEDTWRFKDCEYKDISIEEKEKVLNYLKSNLSRLFLKVKEDKGLNTIFIARNRR